MHTANLEVVADDSSACQRGMWGLAHALGWCAPIYRAWQAGNAYTLTGRLLELAPTVDVNTTHLNVSKTFAPHRPIISTHFDWSPASRKCQTCV